MPRGVVTSPGPVLMQGPAPPGATTKARNQVVLGYEQASGTFTDYARPASTPGLADARATINSCYGFVILLTGSFCDVGRSSEGSVAGFLGAGPFPDSRNRRTPRATPRNRSPFQPSSTSPPHLEDQPLKILIDPHIVEVHHQYCSSVPLADVTMT